MQGNTIHIDLFTEKASTGLLLDVRSPSEYKHAHIPGAISVPLFTDDERRIVGTAYNQRNREEAIRIGLDFFGPKMRPIVEEVEKMVAAKPEGKATPIGIYCWRGGMRSEAIAWLLQLYGLKVFRLSGGYKAFRNRVLKTFSHPFEFRVLGGYTGTGKTEILQKLKNEGASVLDLEQIACHKGSAFGNIDMPPQPGQEMFENLLALELEKFIQSLGTVWVEDESQRIGNLNLPPDLWQTLRRSPIIFLEIGFEQRLKHIVEEYGKLNRERLGHAITRISKRLGGLETKNALSWLEEDNIEACFRILLKYYDKHYHKGLYNRDGLDGLLTTIVAEDVNPINARLLIHQPV